MADIAENVSRETLERLHAYEALLSQWQRKTNLIGSGTAADIWDRHVLDSVQVADLITARNLSQPTIVDIGTGAGLPGLIVAIVLADHGGGNVHLVESNGKKCAFLRTVLAQLSLPPEVVVNVHNGRIETVLPQLKHCDILTARALTSLDGLLNFRLLLPQLGVVSLFQKGVNVDSEIEAARMAFDFHHKTIPSTTAHDSVVLEITDVIRR